MSEFDTLLAKYTEKGNAKIHGALCKCVDKNGIEMYSKTSGYNSVSVDAAPLREDCVLKIASATKLIASVALLQCVEKGLIGLDEPLTKILPELDGKNILKAGSDNNLDFEPSKNKITARHLLSHTSGLGYPFTNPLLMQWKATPAGQQYKDSLRVTEKYNMPLVFEPGTGWLYGCGLDWAGVVVRRLHNGTSLEDYAIENIWRKFKTDGGAERGSDGSLQPHNFWFLDNPEDPEGGCGLSCTAKDYLAVLGDLISDSPRLLKPETIAMMFTPQLVAGSPAMSMLLQLRPAWVTVSGPISDDAVNHGLGGLLLTGEVEEIGQPKGLLAWGGASNIVWFASRELGVAGFFGTQISPFGDPAANELINAWKKDFWSKYNTKT